MMFLRARLKSFIVVSCGGGFQELAFFQVEGAVGGVGGAGVVGDHDDGFAVVGAEVAEEFENGGG